MSLPSDITDQLERLRLVLLRLSDSAEAQLAYLRRLGTPGNADELALEFDDSYKPLRWRLVETGSVLPLIERLDAVDSLIGTMSAGPPDVWRDDALSGRAEWTELRDVAQRALGSFPGAGYATE